jgi:hypothetical protein
MKILIIDTSHNSSLPKVRTFLHFHSDADLVYTFDFLYSEYSSLTELHSDLEGYPEEFFRNPCAYYDAVTSILGSVRKLHPTSVIIYSPGIDECSRLSSEFLYENYIQHFEIYNPGVLDINFSAIDFSLPLPSVKSPLKKLFEKLPFRDILSLDGDDDYDDYYDAG